MQPPVTPEEVEAHYEQLGRNHAATLATLTGRRTRVLQVLLALAVAIVLITLRALHTFAGSPLLLAALLAFVAAIPAYLRLQGKVTAQGRLLSFYQSSLARLAGKSTEPPRTGTDPAQNLRPAHHLYERDLDLLGPDSLFALLATVRTGLGEQGLADYLLHPATFDETVARQQAVRELLPQTELREQIALLGRTSFQQISASFFAEWLAEAPPVFSPAIRPALLFTALVNVLLLLTALTHLRTWGEILPFLALSLGAQGLLCGFVRARVLPLLQGGFRLQANIKLLSEGLALLQRATVTSPRLQHLQQQARVPAGAVEQLKKLDSQLVIVEQRPKEYFLIFSLLLAAGTQAAISIARWKHANAAAMRTWIAAWSEFEALNAIAAYAFENPQNTWPELLPPTHPPLFEAHALAHPLLRGGIANEVSLGADRTRFLLISGSNMSGKSTLMRSIGINAVLAYAGAPVSAASLRLTPLALGASLALTDSLAEGKSKFRAEVERLAGIVEQARHRPVLFLVDEIFSGTNSADRHTAAAAVLRALLGQAALGALSTHDLALTELVTEENGGRNVHMASPNPEDPLAFDYLLKPGPNTSSNALAIVRMLGLDA